MQENKIEVLVTTMYQNDFNKYYEMRLSTDAIIANQADTNESTTTNINGNHVKLITTSTRGLSRNRNIAIENSTADIIIFADDDIVFDDGYEKIISDSFANYPDADAIQFKMRVIATSEDKIEVQGLNNEGFMRATRRNVSSRGVCCLAIKRNALLNSNIIFDENFGSGTENYCGEDTIFWQDLINNGMTIYLSDCYIASIDKSTSTWFDGFNAKRFEVNGKILERIYPRISRLLAVRSAYKFSKRLDEYSMREILKFYNKGISEQRKSKK